MRKTPVALLAVAALSLSVAGASAQIRVVVNGNPVNFEGSQPQEMRGRVMVPLRGVFEQMGAYVGWDAANRMVIAQRGDTSLKLPIGSTIAFVNGRSVPLDVPATIVAGTTMVPLRFVSQTIGARVAWDAPSDTVQINTNGQVASDYGNDRSYYNGTPRRDNYNQSNYNQNNYNNGRHDNDQNYANNGNSDNRYYRGNDQGYNSVDRRQQQPGRAYRRQAAERVTIPASTVIPVTLNQTLNSSSSRPGDTFTLTLRSGADDAGLPAGTKIEGVVREATAAHDNQPGVLDVDLRRMDFPDGSTTRLEGSVIGLDEKSVNRTDSGRLVARADKSKDRLKFIGIGAGAGLLIGALTKQNTLASLLVGAGLGYLANEFGGINKPGNVNLPAGKEFGVRLDRSISVPAGRNYNNLP